jgi:hypothetical protein
VLPSSVINARIGTPCRATPAVETTGSEARSGLTGRIAKVTLEVK